MADATLVERTRPVPPEPGRVAAPERAPEGVWPHRLVVSAVVVALALPYLIRGPVFLADDYVWLRNAHFNGWLSAGGHRMYGRPGALLTYDITFGLLGPHPLPIFLAQVVLWLAAALAIFGLLRRLVSPRVASAVTLVWLVLPNHTSLERWLSTSQAWVALALVAFGISLLIDDTRRERLPWRGIALVAVSVLFYEMTAALALVAVVLVPWLLTGRLQRRTSLIGIAAIAGPTIWALASMSAYPGAAAAAWIDPTTIIPGTLALGLDPRWVTGMAVASVLAAVGAGVLLRGAATRFRRTTQPEWLVLAGLALCLLGVIPQLKLHTDFYGMYDRSNTISGVGAAMVLVGVAWLAGRLLAGRTRQVIAVAALVAFVVVAGLIRVSWDRNYEKEARVVNQGLHKIEHRDLSHPVIVHPPFARGFRLVGLGDGWNASAALQLRTGDPNAIVWVKPWKECAANGPPIDKPQAVYGQTPGRRHLTNCRPGHRS